MIISRNAMMPHFKSNNNNDKLITERLTKGVVFSRRVYKIEWQ